MVTKNKQQLAELTQKASYWWNCLSRHKQGQLIEAHSLNFKGYYEISSEDQIKLYKEIEGNKNARTY